MSNGTPVRTYPPTDTKPIVVPLFREGNDTLLSAGSGVLLTYGNRHFLCTAGHVVGRTSEHRIWVGGCEKPFFMDQPFLRNRVEANHTTEDDPIDFAATELDQDQVANLTTKLRFLGLDIKAQYRPAFIRPVHQLIGFLQCDNLIRERTLTANGLRIEITPDEAIIRRDRNRRNNSHWYIAGIYDPSAPGWRINKQFRGMKDFSGMSGGAWFYGEPFCPGVYREFAGIVLESRVKRRAVTEFIGIGTRAIIDMLHHWFPGLPSPVSTKPQ